MSQPIITGETQQAQEGQGLVEYGLILVLIALVAMGALVGLGKGSNIGFTKTLAAFQGEESSLLQDKFDGSGNMEWQSIFGTWSIIEGRMQGGDRYWTLMLSPVPADDYTYSVDLQTINSRGVQFWDVARTVFRFQDTKNYYSLLVDRRGTIELAKTQNGRWVSSLAWGRTGADPLAEHTFKVKVTDSRIQAWLDDQQYIDFVDPDPIPTGGVGIANDASLTAFDNVEVIMEVNGG